MTIIEEIYKLLEKLTQDAQIQRVMQLIEMPNDLRPSNGSNLYKVKTDIVNWAEGKENGEEYRLTRLKNLKDKIQFVIGDRNLPANLCSKDFFSLEKCVTLLRSLDYAPDEDYFRKLIELKEIAFFIQASNVKVQNWLIERLVHHVPSSILAKKYLIDFQKLAVKSCIENFWHEFIDTPTNANPNITSAINDLTDVCQNRPVIILMRRLNYLDQETIAQICKFWDELVQKIRSTQNRTIQSRFVLLLVAEPTEYKKKSIFLKETFNFTKLNQTKIKKILQQKNTLSGNNFLLSPMDKLDPKDVQVWLQKTEVLLSLKFHEQNYIDKLLNKTIPCWVNVPETVLDDICIHIFNLHNGFAEIEAMYRW